MKKNIILTIFAATILLIPSVSKADFEFGRIIDPACFWACENEPDVIYNTNSNNVNSNINSPNSNVITTPVYPVYTPIYDYSYNYNYESPLDATCYPTQTVGDVDETITWRASGYGGNGNYYISWSGTNGLSGIGTSVTKRYSSDGVKNASIMLSSGGKTITRNCGSVEIRDYDRHDRDYYDRDYYDRDYYDYRYDRYDRDLTVSCSVNSTFAPVGTEVTWKAYASGGSGTYRYDWNGTDGIDGSRRDLDVVYNSPGTKTARVTVRSGGETETRTCSNSVLIGEPISYINQNTVTPNYTYTPPVVKTETVKKVEAEKESTLTSLFSLENVPWGWVAILVILILLFIIVYLVFNSKKI